MVNRLSCMYIMVFYNVFSLRYKCMILEKTFEIWYQIKSFLTLYLGEFFCLLRGGCETDVRTCGVFRTCFIVCVS